MSLICCLCTCSGREAEHVEAALHQHQPSAPPFLSHLLVLFLVIFFCTCSGREPEHVEAALHRALDAYHHGQQWWREELVPRAMRQDWSWSRSAHLYLDIYRSIMR
jgi:hypothetical protein